MLNHNNSTILILARQKSPRLLYTVDLLMRVILKLPHNISNDKKAFQFYTGPKINYTDKRLTAKEIWISPSNLLFETEIKSFTPNFFKHSNLSAAFQNNQQDDFGFDLFALTFYLASRYEEYTQAQNAFDKHGRFRAEESQAYKNDFLEIPLINAWAELLAQKLIHHSPSIELPINTFQFIPTYDIDIAWAFRHKTIFRKTLWLLITILKRNWQQLKTSREVISGQAVDPFDVYPYLLEALDKYNLKGIFFFLLGDLSRYDRNIHPKNPYLKKLILHLHSSHQIGIHPSYNSHKSYNQLLKEIKRLGAILETVVDQSRQHYLKFMLPKTFQKLLDAGIKHDYSMGYASQIGFRASISTPYPWYDLSKEKPTALIINPFQVMDGTLKNYLKLTPEEGLNRTLSLLEITAKYNATFILLWHNSSFSNIGGWDNWEIVHDGVLQKAYQLMDTSA